jgi:predicted phage terminase large subunit-like protein
MANVDLLADPAKLILKLDAVEYEASLYEFLRAAWRQIDPSPWVDGWPIEAIAEHLEAVVDGQIRRLIINIPPRMGKSSCVSVALPAWCWAQTDIGPNCGPQTQFLHASYAHQLSLRDSVKCRRLIESDWYQQHWGHRFKLTTDQNTKSRFSNDKGGERLITSITAGITGEGMSIGIVDDPNAANEAFSEATIQSTIDWWDATFSTRLNDPKTGAYIIIQQRLAEDDLTGHVLSKDAGEWTHLVLPMHYDPERSFITSIGWKDPRKVEGELLWPDRFGTPEVKSLERTLGPWQAAGQLEQRPEPKGGGVIKREWWLNWPDQACGKCEVPKGKACCSTCPQPVNEFPPMDYIVAYLDTAYTEKTENDFSALTVWGVFTTDPLAVAGRYIDPEGRPQYMDRVFTEQAPKVMLLSAWQDRLPIHELVKRVGSTCGYKKPGLCVDLLLIENKAAGISVAQELRRLYADERFGVMLHDPKSTDKLSRLYSVQHLFAEGMIYAPDRAWADMVITQVATFPHGKHDDLVDTTSGALRHLRDAGLLVRSPEKLAEIEAAKQYQKPPTPLYPGMAA